MDVNSEVFTDEGLAPTRTTRATIDHVRDWAELVPGDEILVSTEPYDGDQRPRWCRVVWLAPGDAAVYPYKASVAESHVGQFAAREILAWRRPLDLHRSIREAGGR